MLKLIIIVQGLPLGYLFFNIAWKCGREKTRRRLCLKGRMSVMGMPGAGKTTIVISGLV